MHHPLFLVKRAYCRARSANHRLPIILQGAREEGYLAAERLINTLVEPKQQIDFPPILCQSFPDKNVIPATLSHLPVVNRSNIKQILGRDAQTIIFDIYAGFNPNLLAAATGALCGGGILVIIAPPYSDWDHFPDPEYDSFTDLEDERAKVKPRFLSRVQRVFQCEPSLLSLITTDIINAPDYDSHSDQAHSDQAHSDQAHIEEVKGQRSGEAIPVPKAPASAPELNYAKPPNLQEQQSLIQALLQSKSQVNVITADRGRGKSATLGLYIAALVQQHDKRITPRHIVVTAPQKMMIETLFHHLTQAVEQTPDSHQPQNSEPTKSVSSRRLQLGAFTVSYLAPCRIDLLDKRNQHRSENIDLLVVDEAAATPYPLLYSWIDQIARLDNGNTRLILSTTTDGYEGTGNSFQTRLLPLLDKFQLSWEHHQMIAPIRWQSDDPLERLINRSLCLKPRMNPLPDQNHADQSGKTRPRAIRIHTVCDQKLDNLDSLFALLTMAHYRTTPSDLRQLLDAPNTLLLYATAFEDIGETGQSTDPIIGLLWATEEGGLTPSLAEKIRENQRRLKGHLIPQTLLIHSDSIEADCRSLADRLTPSDRFLRVVRLAVHPEFQSQGIGSQLVSHLIGQADKRSCRAVGTSFSDHPSLIKFWHHAGFQSLRIGCTISTVTGRPSRLMIREIDRTKIDTTN